MTLEVYLLSLKRLDLSVYFGQSVEAVPSIVLTTICGAEIICLPGAVATSVRASMG